MSVLVLATRTDIPHYSFQTELEGTVYTLEFRWNERESAWYMTIGDAAGTPILAGRKVVLGLGLLARFRILSLPPGELTAIDTSGQDLPPGVNDLGGRVRLIYTESTSLPAAYVAA